MRIARLEMKKAGVAIYIYGFKNRLLAAWFILRNGTFMVNGSKEYEEME